MSDDVGRAVADPPADALRPADLTRLAETVSRDMGLHFSPERWADLQRGFRAAADEFGFADVRACLEWLGAGPLARRQVEVLAAHLTVGETYFFRERTSFEVLEREVLPELIASRRDGERRLRVWSAACCTGEEAYSLAISLTKVLRDPDGWDVTLLATDINPRFLKKAAEGSFGDWSFRDAPPGVRDRYFRKNARGRYEILPELKRLVRFDYLNLAEDVYPSLLGNTNAMDVIFCRNVLIYLEPDQIRTVVTRLRRCLVEGGWLFVGAAEASHLLFADLESVQYPGLIAYRNRPPQPLPALARAVPAPSVSTPVPRAPRVAHTTVPRTPERLLAKSEPIELARYCANRGELTEALAHCDRAVAADKLSPAVHYLRGTIILEKGEPAEAAAAFRRAVYLDPGFVMAHYALGHLAWSLGRRGEAGRHFANASRLLARYGPDDAPPESEGITARRLAEMIAVMQDKGNAA